MYLAEEESDDVVKILDFVIDNKQGITVCRFIMGFFLYSYQTVVGRQWFLKDTIKKNIHQNISLTFSYTVQVLLSVDANFHGSKKRQWFADS